MRILTSHKNHKGLISILEAESDAPQNVVFCVPIQDDIASDIETIFDFVSYFREGISTRIKHNGKTTVIHLKLFNEFGIPILDKINSFPKFTTKLENHQVDFYLSRANFNEKDEKKLLEINNFYSGDQFYEELRNKKLVILQPNWTQLDNLFLKEGILFIDWQ